LKKKYNINTVKNMRTKSCKFRQKFSDDCGNKDLVVIKKCFDLYSRHREKETRSWRPYRISSFPSNGARIRSESSSPELSTTETAAVPPCCGTHESHMARSEVNSCAYVLHLIIFRELHNTHYHTHHTNQSKD
jgi:hypothetical protein